MTSIDSVHSDEKLQKLLHKSKLNNAYQQLNPNVSSYMNIANCDEKEKDESHQTSLPKLVSIHNKKSNVSHDSSQNDRNGTYSGSIATTSRVFSRSATTIVNNTTQSQAKNDGVSIISNFHRIASLAARASETVNSSRPATHNDSHRDDTNSANYDNLALLNIANQQAVSHVYKYKLQVTCNFQIIKPANFFLYTTIPINCQFGSINFEKQVEMIDPQTKLLTTCTLRFNILHGKMEKISNKYAEAVYVYTNKMINMFENGFHRVLFSNITNGKAGLPGKHFFSKMKQQQSKLSSICSTKRSNDTSRLPHIRKNGAIDYNVLMAQFTNNIEVAYNHWVQQFRSKNKREHLRQHKLLNDYMIVPARQVSLYTTIGKKLYRMAHVHHSENIDFCFCVFCCIEF